MPAHHIWVIYHCRALAGKAFAQSPKLPVIFTVDEERALGCLPAIAQCCTPSTLDTGHDLSSNKICSAPQSDLFFLVGFSNHLL